MSPKKRLITQLIYANIGAIIVGIWFVFMSSSGQIPLFDLLVGFFQDFKIMLTILFCLVFMNFVLILLWLWGKFLNK